MNDDINDQSLWNNPAIEETIKRTEPEKYYRYQKMAQSLFDKSNVADPHIINIEAATQIKLMLRDGLHPSLLDENEKELYISTFGQESFDKFSTQDFIEAPELLQELIESPPPETQELIESVPPSTPTSTGCFDPKNLMSQKVAHSAAKKRPGSKTNNELAAKRIAFGP